MPNTCECVLTRTVIISTKNGGGSEKLVSKQTFPNMNVAAATLATEKTAVYDAMRDCYGRGFEVDDVIMIGDIIVDANDITAVGFRINPVQIFVGTPEPISDDPINDSEDPETK